jgi:Spy/CpxP family protein refolding chaperone
MKFSRAAIALYVGLIFASGIVLGVYGQRLYTVSQDASKPGPRPNPEVIRKRVEDMYTDRLHLSADQVQKLNAIMDETRQRVDEVRRGNRASFQKIHEEQDAKIRNMLTPDQQFEFDKIRKEREERRKQAGRGITVTR